MKTKRITVQELSALDDFDRAILEAMQEDNRLTSHEIGQRVGLSPTACQRRLRRLRSIGAIVADVSLVSPDIGGDEVTLIVGVTMDSEHPHVIDAFKKLIAKAREVTQCYYVTGKHDFYLVVRTASIAEYTEFTRRVFFDNPSVKQFETSAVMSTVKFNTRVPVR